MTGLHHIPGRRNLGRNILRAVFLTTSAIGGLFVLATSAAVALFLVTGFAVTAALSFAFCWARAKLFGRPFGPQVHFGTACADMESRLKAQGFTSKEDGPVVDARRTPQGWTVDD